MVSNYKLLYGISSERRFIRIYIERYKWRVRYITGILIWGNLYYIIMLQKLNYMSILDILYYSYILYVYYITSIYHMGILYITGIIKGYIILNLYYMYILQIYIRLYVLLHSYLPVIWYGRHRDVRFLCRMWPHKYKEGTESRTGIIIMIYRLLGYERAYLPLHKVPFISEDTMIYVKKKERNSIDS